MTGGTTSCDIVTGTLTSEVSGGHMSYYISTDECHVRLPLMVYMEETYHVTVTLTGDMS